jgi:chorismate--pyruvate lyase
MRGWLVDNRSLTQKLIDHSTHFRVHRLEQERARCLADESGVFALPPRACVVQREVVLQCDSRPVVYAHTVVPLAATAADWPFFSSLGERPLGTTLFGDPLVSRGKLEYARLHAQHPLMRRVAAAVDENLIATSLFARRCLYRRRSGALLVTEIFLPAIKDLEPRKPLRGTVSSNESTG